jgi:hypothetical protein
VPLYAGKQKQGVVGLRAGCCCCNAPTWGGWRASGRRRKAAGLPLPLSWAAMRASFSPTVQVAAPPSRVRQGPDLCLPASGGGAPCAARRRRRWTCLPHSPVLRPGDRLGALRRLCTCCRSPGRPPLPATRRLPTQPPSPTPLQHSQRATSRPTASTKAFTHTSRQAQQQGGASRAPHAPETLAGDSWRSKGRRTVRKLPGCAQAPLGPEFATGC